MDMGVPIAFYSEDPPLAQEGGRQTAAEKGAGLACLRKRFSPPDGFNSICAGSATRTPAGHGRLVRWWGRRGLTTDLAPFWQDSCSCARSCLRSGTRGGVGLGVYTQQSNPVQARHFRTAAAVWQAQGQEQCIRTFGRTGRLPWASSSRMRGRGDPDPVHHDNASRSAGTG